LFSSTQTSFIFSVPENEPPGTSVGTLVAEDLDSSLFNSFLFAFLDVDVVDAFSLDAKTGSITSRRHLDRERQAQHQFVVVVYDPRSPPMSGTTSVIVNILDKNDHRPEFIFPTTRNNSVFLSNRAPVGYTVAEVGLMKKM